MSNFKNLNNLKVLFTEEQIQNRVDEMAKQIDADYEGEELVVVSILNGALFFTADLVKRMKTPITLQTLRARSYFGTESTGSISISNYDDTDLTGKNILIVEDIIDTGATLKKVKEFLLSKKPNSIKIAVFVDKKERRIVPVDIDYVGFEIPDKFIIGYGFDLEGKYRNIPYMGYLE